MTDKPKTAPVYLQIREDGKVWAVLEDGTPLAHQTDMMVTTDARAGMITAAITLKAAGWLPGLPDTAQIEAEAEAIKRTFRTRR